MALVSALELPSRPLLLLVVFYVVYFLVRGVYRITFHPLAKFPGPKLAAFTRWYEVYFEVYRGGRFSEHIEHLHERYGPIVRVNPFELHINDPSFYDELYNFSPDIDRPSVTMNNLQNTPTFEAHKIRRRAVDPYFSKSAVLKLEDLVASCVKELCHWFHEARKTSSPVDLTILARCLTSDVITEYVFAKPYGFLHDPIKGEAFFTANNSVFQTIFLFRESAIVSKIFDALRAIPPSWLPPGHMSHSFVPFVNSVKDRINLTRQRRKKGELAAAGHRVIFDDWDTLDLPKRDKSLQCQMDSALMFVSAGFETTAFTIETAVLHVLTNPDIHTKLKQELAPVIAASNRTDGIPSWMTLEKLPYLTAVIHESLRISLGVASRLPRKNTRSAMVYKQWVIPKGQLVSMTQRDILYSAEIYPDPTRFYPERWLKREESKALLNKYLVTFSKGARRCVGIHLAYAGLYLALTAIFGQFELELYQTTRKDVDPKVDYFAPKPEVGSKGVRVLVK